MSFTAMAWASKQKTKSSSQKLVLLMLANYADDQDKCWPSKQTLADMCCMSKSGICKTITQLESAGFLVIVKREGTSSIIRLHTGVHQVDRGCPPSGQGVSTQWTGGVHPVDTNLSMNQSEEPITETISSDAAFEEFWAAYPKRAPHANPKHPAKLLYIKARKELNVSHETIVNAVKSYAATMAGKDSQLVAQAQTWLRQRRWEDDHQLPEEAVSPNPEMEAGGKWLDEIVAVYPGHVGDRREAAKLITVELSKGVQGRDLWEAARKYKLFCKGPPYEDRKITPAMLETWLKFKWREMDGYEFCTVGPDRIRTVRPKKVAA
jgi:hypothetical protein